jgi:hypothetical protein
VRRFIGWLGIAASKFHDGTTRYGSSNEHNALVPRDGWVEPWEKAAILAFHQGHPLEGYRRLAFMMLDADLVAVSPSSVYRVLRQAGVIGSRDNKPSLKGKGFQQPLRAHQHWHDRAGGQVGRPRPADLRRAGPQAGCGAGAEAGRPLGESSRCGDGFRSAHCPARRGVLE